MMNAEWSMMNAEWWPLLHRKRQDWIVPQTVNSALLHRKRQDWIHTRLTCRVLSKIQAIYTDPSLFTTHYSDIKTLFHPNREMWSPKKEKRIVAQPNYSLSDIKTLFHPNRELWPSKKEKHTVSQSQSTLHCYLEKDKTELFSISTKNAALLLGKRQDLPVPHPNRDLWKKIDRTVSNSKLKRLIRHQDTISC